MDKTFLVITQTAKDKEIAPWWECRSFQAYSVELFSDFASAKTFMRKEICRLLETKWETLLQGVFGEFEDPCLENSALFDDEFWQMLSAFEEEDESEKKLEELTKAIITNADFFPETIETITATDDADHCVAMVCNENYVLVHEGGIRIEYNVHRMESENFLYYFNIWVEKDAQMECLMSVKLLNTRENIDNTNMQLADRVTCPQLKMGTAVQDDAPDAVREPIVWDVIQEKEDRLLVVSHKCLDYRLFGDGINRTVWGQSEIRRWLNDEFLHDAFTEKDRQRILLTRSRNGRGIKTTEDYVFLLSEAEYQLLSEENRRAFPTKRARAVYGDFLQDRYTEPYSAWWLRSRGLWPKFGRDAMRVCADGELDGTVRSDTRRPAGIRPAMWIKK